MRKGGAAAALPQFWSKTDNGAGATVLTYAVRGGKAQPAITALGAVCIVGGLWGAFWLLTGAEITIAGIIFVLLVPGGLTAFGAHCLNIAWLDRTDYAFSRHSLVARRHSLWGGARTEVARSAVSALIQQYSPPERGSASGSRGTWTTFLDYRDKGGVARQLAFDGLRSDEEAGWLGAWVAEWTGLPLKRGFGDAYQEADREELPKLEE